MKILIFLTPATRRRAAIMQGRKKKFLPWYTYYFFQHLHSKVRKIKNNQNINKGSIHVLVTNIAILKLSNCLFGRNIGNKINNFRVRPIG